jgi:putative ABC transport system substrate-binding protein
MIGGDALFTSHSEQLAEVAVRHGVPTFYKGREFATAGGLIAYGSDIADTYRQAGNYTGWVLNGEKPADLPVQRATKMQLIINFKTAKALGITIPLPVSGRADAVIE